MKTDPPDSLVGESPTLDRYVRSARNDDASDEELQRISAKLAAAGAFATASTPPRRAAWKLYVKLGIGIAVLAGGFVSWRAVDVAAPPPVAAIPPALALAPVEARVPAADVPAPQMAIPVDALPSVAPSAATSVPVRHAAPVASAQAPAESEAPPPPKELDLVQRAQAMLASDPERALAITREQARLYPAGEYIQEREVFAVEALSRLGRKDEASARANALLQRFPRTPYVSRLEIATGRRLSAPSASSEAARP
jgi:hypothetical protein